MPLDLSTPVTFIKRVGDRVAAGLSERGILTVEDLLYQLPFRYEDRLHPKPLSTYNPGDMASLIGEVRGTVLLRTRSGTIFEMTLGITPPPADSDEAMQGLLAPPPRFAGAPQIRHPNEGTPQIRHPDDGAPQIRHPNEGTPQIRYPDDDATQIRHPNEGAPQIRHPDEGAPQIRYPEALASGLISDKRDSGVLTPAEPPPILETVKCLWFHGAYLKDKFHAGQRLALYGKLEASRSGMLASRSGNAPAGYTKFKLIQPTFEILPQPNSTGEDAEFTILEMGRIVPIYESLGGKTPWGAKLTSRWHRRVLWTVFKDLAEAAESPTTKPGAPYLDSEMWAGRETLPLALLQRLHLPTRLQAFQQIHFPPANTPLDLLATARTPAHRRLIFEEFFYLELGLELKRRKLRARHGPALTTSPQVREALKQVLPFKPTAAQKRVLGEIVADMRRSQPMRRLLQGDVGSGKTIVAFQAALVAIENGFQVALMAPTEILATQHFLSARKLLADKRSPRSNLPYRIALLTGSLDDRTKRDTRARISRGEVDLAIGTHALVEPNVDFPNLGLVIVDEQHRFGVQQRFQLMRKPSPQSAPNPSTSDVKAGKSGYPDPSGSGFIAPNKNGGAGSPGLQPRVSPPATEPHVLVMTATPIPRTLALTVYGDMEASILDELPPGRTPITTRRMPEPRAPEVWDFLRKQVALGRQAYIVYPIIEGAPDDQPELDFPTEPEPNPSAKPTRATTRPKLRSATEMHAHLAANELAGLRLGLLHGRMSTDDKDVTMARFKRGELDVLIATTVIEVGVDVPNATVMVIEHADRFGLAQLHQLRGRVGRGAAKSFCILLTGDPISPEAELRLDAMTQTQDGFLLAELDLQQRGPGEFFGTKQAGLPDLRIANLARDRDLLELAKQEAAAFVHTPDPTTPRHEREAVWSRLKLHWQRRYGLVEA